MDFSKPLVRISGLSHKFGSCWVLRDISLDIDHGEIYAILGHNGAGKTTLLRILLGFFRATQGAVSINGLDVRSHSSGRLSRYLLGVLMESNGLYERFTAWENLELIAKIYRCDTPVWKHRAEELLEMADLGSHKHEVVAKWSAGMKRKLALIRAFAHSPQLVVLDEPTSGLDPISKESMRSIIIDARRHACAILIASQDLWEIERVVDRMTVLRDGTSLFSGKWKELRNMSQIRLFRFVSGHTMKSIERVMPSNCEIVRSICDNQGISVVVRMQSQKDSELFTNGTLFSRGSVVELPQSLQDIYIELDRQSRNNAK